MSERNRANRKHFVHRLKGLCALTMAFILAAMFIPGMPSQQVKAADGGNYYFIVDVVADKNGIFTGQESLAGKHVYDELSLVEEASNYKDNGYVKLEQIEGKNVIVPSQGSPLTKVGEINAKTDFNKGKITSDTFTLDIQDDATFYIGCVASVKDYYGYNNKSGAIIHAKVDEEEKAVTTARYDAGKASIELPAGKYELSMTGDWKYDRSLDNYSTVFLSIKTLELYGGAGYFPIKVEQSAGKIKVSWDKQEKAENYEVHIDYCGNSIKKVVKKTSGNSVALKKIHNKKINFKKNFKCYVVALNKNGKKIARSAVGHVAGKDRTDYTNPKAIKVSTKSVTIKKGETKKVKATVTLEDSKKKVLTHADKVRFVSDKPSVATVNKSGKITGVKKGTCNVYAIAQNGLCKKVSVTVTE